MINKTQLMAFVALVCSVLALFLVLSKSVSVDYSSSDASTPSFTQFISGSSFQRVGYPEVMTIKSSSDGKVLNATNQRGAIVGKYTTQSGTMNYSINGKSSGPTDLAARIVYIKDDVAALTAVASQVLNAQVGSQYKIVKANNIKYEGMVFQVTAVSNTNVSIKITAIPGVTSGEVKAGDTLIFPKGSTGTTTTTVPFV